jgi:hypothetical protein
MQENNSIICPIGRQKCLRGECEKNLIDTGLPECKNNSKLFAKFLSHPIFRTPEGKIHVDDNFRNKVQTFANHFNIPFDLYYEEVKEELNQLGVSLDSEE